MNAPRMPPRQHREDDFAQDPADRREGSLVLRRHVAAHERHVEERIGLGLRIGLEVGDHLLHVLPCEAGRLDVRRGDVLDLCVQVCVLCLG